LKKIFLPVIIPAVLLVGLPLAGVMAAGENLGLYWEFPPLTRYVVHAPFSWPLFMALVLLGAMVAEFLEEENG